MPIFHFRGVYMRAVFYNVSESPLKINKILENGTVKEIKLLRTSNNLQFDCVVSDYDELKNYVYIPNMKRYYFVKNTTIQNNGLFVLSLEVDVLTTYKNLIMANKTRIVESENVINADKVDYIGENVETVRSFNFPSNPFVTNTDVLICVRG